MNANKQARFLIPNKLRALNQVFCLPSAESWPCPIGKIVITFPGHDDDCPGLLQVISKLQGNRQV